MCLTCDKAVIRWPLGWVALQLFDHKDQLRSGLHALRLWPNETANPIGSNIEMDVVMLAGTRRSPSSRM